VVLLLLIIFNKDITIKDAVEIIDVSDSTVKRMFKELKSKNLIRHKGSKKTGRWILNIHNSME
jgi:Mn-dependent DtxR family transcriptional regulator